MRLIRLADQARLAGAPPVAIGLIELAQELFDAGAHRPSPAPVPIGSIAREFAVLSAPSGNIVPPGLA